MNWKAEIIKHAIVEGRLTVGILYSKGKKSFRENLVDATGSLNTEDTIKRRLAELERLESSTLSTGDVITYTEPSPVPEPSLNDTKLSNFRRKFEELKEKKAFVDLGLLEKEKLEPLRNELVALGKELGKL